MSAVRSDIIYNILCHLKLEDLITIPMDIINIIMFYIQYHKLKIANGSIDQNQIPLYITDLTVSCNIMLFNSNNIVRLTCSFCNQIELPILPNCEVLICRYNNLTSLPQLNKCTYLDCEKNKLCKLPPLPECEELICNKNNITSLQKMNKLKRLECNDNEIVTLPYFKNIEYINCISNNIIYKPLQPSNCIISWYIQSWVDVWGDDI